VRVRATVEDFVQLESYEGYTCVTSNAPPRNVELDRELSGKPRFAWRRGVSAAWPKQEELIRVGKIEPAEALIRLRDVATGKSVGPHRGTVRWNAFRQRWIAVFVEEGGTSQLGEVWYAEATLPEGPWTNCVKIVSHERYSFYNPLHHSYFDEDGGRAIYFEGTYTHTFSGNSVPTPRYDYNQIMYRLDLADERLKRVSVE